MAAVALVDVRIGDVDAGRLLRGCDGVRQCVAVVEIPQVQVDTEDPSR